MIGGLVCRNSIAVLRTLWRLSLSEIENAAILFSSFSGVTLLLLSHVKVFDLELLGFFHVETESEASELRLTYTTSRTFRRLLIQRHSHSSHFK